MEAAVRAGRSRLHTLGQRYANMINRHNNPLGGS
jgi:hypothetical protein